MESYKELQITQPTQINNYPLMVHCNDSWFRIKEDKEKGLICEFSHEPDESLKWFANHIIQYMNESSYYKKNIINHQVEKEIDDFLRGNI